jgi:hypothetical protein
MSRHFPIPTETSGKLLFLNSNSRSIAYNVMLLKIKDAAPTNKKIVLNKETKPNCMTRSM